MKDDGLNQGEEVVHAQSQERLIADPSGLVCLGAKVLVLPPKERAALHLLLMRSPHLVTKDEFADRVWLGREMSDESLVRCIYGLRRRLRLSRQSVWIEAAYGCGYRLLRPSEPQPELATPGEGEQLPLGRPTQTVV